MAAVVNGEQGFLHEILSVLFVARHTVGQTEQSSTVTLYEDTKGMVIPLPSLVGSRRIGPFHPAQSLDFLARFRLGVIKLIKICEPADISVENTARPSTLYRYPAHLDVSQLYF